MIHSTKLRRAGTTTADERVHQAMNGGAMPGFPLASASPNYRPTGRVRIPLRRKAHYNTRKFNKSFFTKKRNPKYSSVDYLTTAPVSLRRSGPARPTAVIEHKHKEQPATGLRGILQRAKASLFHRRNNKRGDV